MASNIETGLVCDVDTMIDPITRARFEHELQQVMNNIFDERTPVKGTRSVTLKFTFSPNDDRSITTMKCDVDSHQCKAKSVSRLMATRMTDDGSVMMTELTAQVPGQIDITGSESPVPNVIQMARREAK